MGKGTFIIIGADKGIGNAIARELGSHTIVPFEPTNVVYSQNVVISISGL